VAYKNVEKLLENLKQIFQFLSWEFNIPGMTDEDITQELNLFVLETWNKKDVSGRKLGWWFLRCKWHLLNKVKKSERMPLDNAISLDKFLKEERGD